MHNRGISNQIQLAALRYLDFSLKKDI